MDENGDVHTWWWAQYESLSQFAELADIVKLDTGGDIGNIALDATGDVWIWKPHSNPIVGVYDPTGIYPYVGSMGPVADVAAGAAHFVALDENGDVWAWGANGSGQLGSAAPPYSDEPVLVTAGPGQPDAIAVQLSPSSVHAPMYGVNTAAATALDGHGLPLGPGVEWSLEPPDPAGVYITQGGTVHVNPNAQAGTVMVKAAYHSVQRTEPTHSGDRR